MNYILFIAAWYPNRNDSMLGLFVQRHAEVLSNKNKIIVLNVVSDIKNKKLIEIENTISKNVDTIIVYYKKYNREVFLITPFLKLIYSLIAYLKGIKLVVKKFGYPRFIHLHVLTFRTGVLAYIIKIMKGIPYVITEHSSYYLPEKGVNRGFIWEFFTRYFSKKSQGITAVSEYLRNAMIKKGFFVNTFEVVRNVVPDYFFRDYIANKNTDKIILSNITCFDDSVKNISGIVKTIGKLKEIRKDFILYLVGDGPDKKKIETMVNTMNLNDFILFTGLLEGEELLKIYQISDFTVLFSYYETMAVVIAESMACGKPVVASGVGGIPELINSSTGLLVRPGDEDDLLNKINLMINDYKNYDSRYIREYAYNLFSEKAIEEQFLRFYSFVINS